ncbi:Protein of unknown function [Bacillus mycoides]|nr:Protein of unknown function [Bacillus mycoides]
MDNTLVD